MGDATSLLLLAQGGSAVAGGLGAFGQASAIRAQADQQRRVLQANAELSRIQAADAIARGGRLSQQQLQATRNLIGRQRAGFAAQGVDISSGTPADVQADTAALGALDAMTIRNNAFRQAFGFRLQSIGQEQQAAFTGISGRARARSTLATGALGIARQAALTGFFLEANRAPAARLTREQQVDEDLRAMRAASRSGFGRGR